MFISVPCPTTQLHRHRKQPISSVAVIPQISSQNSETTHGDKWEHWRRDEGDMDQSHWTVKPWSLAVLQLAGKFIFMIGIIFPDKNILVVLRLKSGIFKMKVTRWLIQPFQITSMSGESAFTSFLSISVPTRVRAEKYFNKIRSQKPESNVLPDGRLFTVLYVGEIRWFWQLICLQLPAGCVWYRQSNTESIHQSNRAIQKFGKP